MCRGRRWETAIEEDWSRAISSARVGKIVAMRGEVGVGVERLVWQIWIVGVGWRGCVLVVFEMLVLCLGHHVDFDIPRDDEGVG